MSRLRRVASALWRGVREWSGDAAYETYLRRAGANPLSREQFWLDSLNRRYERVSRCC
jgi:Selenoprotein, putative